MMMRRKIDLMARLLTISILLSSALGIASADVDRIVSQAERDEIAAIQKAIDAKGAKWTAGATSVSDFSAEEKKRLGSAEIVSLPKGTRVFAPPVGATIPYGTFDWRNKDGQNWMTPVKSQGSCGSCWAFSVVGVVEAKINIDAGNPNLNVDLSEQQLVSRCCSYCGDCGGGYTSSAFSYMKSSGAPDEDCFEYIRRNSSCTPCSDWTERAYRIENYMYIKSTTDAFKVALQEYGPISVVLRVPDDWFYYTGGIYEPVLTSDKSKWANHAVILVGYNDPGGYWIIKNSYGGGWGSSGYGKVKYGDLEQYNCAIAATQTVSPYSAPTATAYANITFGKAPLTVSFTGSGNDPDGYIVSYYWDFGDGTTSTSQNPSHTYPTVGTYTAVLTVTDNDGLTGSDDVTILVVDDATGRWIDPVAAAASSFARSGFEANRAIDNNLGTKWMSRWGDGVSSWIRFDMGGIKMMGKVRVMAYIPMTVDVQVSNNASTWTTVTSSFDIDQSDVFVEIPFTQTSARYVRLWTTSSSSNYASCIEFDVFEGMGENESPTATASASPTSGTAPLAVSFTGLGEDSDGTIASYYWHFGDGGASSTLQSPTYTYTTAGTYIAVLTVTDNKGATGADTVTITVTTGENIPPTATASASPTSGTAPLTVSFIGLGEDDDGTIVSYYWDFGDGESSTLQIPSHTYTTAQVYTAVLTVTDNDGATGTDNVSILVTDGNISPTATASATPTSGTAPLAVSFTGLGEDDDGTIVSYYWDFGDGGSGSVLQNPTYTYDNVGTYEAVLTVTDNDGATGTDNVTIIVTGSEPGGWVNPVAATASSYYSGSFVPEKAIDDNTGTRWYSKSREGPPCWIQFDMGSVKQVSKVRAMISKYEVPMTLDVQVSNDATSWETVVPDFTATQGDIFVEIPFATQKNVRYIRLYETNFARTYGQCTEFDAYVGGDANQPPVATASATPTSGTAPLAVSFTGLGEDDDGTIVSYYWDFGDGGSGSVLQNPTYTYDNVGTYEAVLTVTDNDGATGTDTVTITVTTSGNIPPVATASASPTSGIAPLEVTFIGLGEDSDGTIVSYYWHFGDGGASSVLQDPTYTYNNSGTYIAVLTVTDNDGATGTDSVTITVTGSGTWAWTNPVEAYASSYHMSSYKPEKAIDDYTQTSWISRSGVAPHWIYFDMGSIKTMSKVRVMQESWYKPTTMDVQTSNNASSWTTVVSDFATPEGDRDALIEIPFTQRTARYVRLWITAVPFTRSYGSFTEVDVYTLSVTKKDVETEKEKLPTVFNLSSYPNPFVKRTTLKYQLPRESRISITIYDMTGKIVKTLVNEKKTAGYYEANWNTKDLASGIYFAKFKTDGYQSITKLILMK